MDAVTRLITNWTRLRAEAHAAEAATHPDITDKYGRVWTWYGGSDTYSHCGAAAPSSMIPDFGFPTQRALDNPNYMLCDICLDGRTRNVPDCDPLWGPCSHPMHQG